MMEQVNGITCDITADKFTMKCKIRSTKVQNQSIGQISGTLPLLLFFCDNPFQQVMLQSNVSIEYTFSKNLFYRIESTKQIAEGSDCRSVTECRLVPMKICEYICANTASHFSTSKKIPCLLLCLNTSLFLCGLFALCNSNIIAQCKFGKSCMCLRQDVIVCV